MFITRLPSDDYHCDCCRQFNAIYQVILDENDYETLEYNCKKCFENNCNDTKSDTKEKGICGEFLICIQMKMVKSSLS